MNESILSWQNFYLLVGTAAATLIGLLFVAISINIERLQDRPATDIQLFGVLTYNCFFYVLVFAIVFLIPGQSPLGVGLPLLLLGALALHNTWNQYQRVRKTERTQSTLRFSRRFIVPLLSLSLLVGLAIMISLDISLALYGLVLVVVLLLGSAGQNAWVLLVQTRSKEKSKDD